VGVLSKILSVSTQKQTINLHSIDAVLQQLIAQHPEEAFFLKIDCEGSEYDIFKKFKIKGIPAAVKMIVMEWHENGPEPLTAILKDNGFSMFYTYSKTRKLGMIYAGRNA